MARPNGPVVACVINLKGGVGKSTICALLARHGFTHRGLDVMVVDIDPQANISQGLMRNDYRAYVNSMEPSIVEVFNGHIPPGPGRPSPTTLGPTSAVKTINRQASRSLELLPSRFDFSDTLLGAVRPDSRALARFLSANYQHKDLILIDCAPTESILTQAAYHASGKVLVPVRPEYFATIGFPLLQQSLTSFRRANLAHQIDVCGVVINNAFYDGGNNGGPEKTRAMVEIQDEATKNGWSIYNNQLPHSRGFPKQMRGDFSYPGNADLFPIFANEFFRSVGL